MTKPATIDPDRERFQPFPLFGVWYPNPTQRLFLDCPVFECLLHGSRKGGKTDALLMDYAQFVGLGFGAAWRGIIFRRTYTELRAEVIPRALQWFNQFPSRVRPRYNRTDKCFTFPDGEELLLRYLESELDYWLYHGSQFPWVGYEELTTWPNLGAYDLTRSLCVTAAPHVPRRMRSNTNPWGVGHQAVKARFAIHPPGKVVVEDGVERTNLRSHWSDNVALLENDPDAIKRILAHQPEHVLKAWGEGDWDIIAGGMLADLWRPAVHSVPAFAVPSGWPIYRAFDWGSDKPFSIGWWTESNGEEFELGGAVACWPRGTLCRVGEWYGWTGEPNRGCRMIATAIGEGILEREATFGWSGRVRPGPADHNIFEVSEGDSLDAKMSRLGVSFQRATKGPGSRINGAQLLRDRLAACLESPMVEPGVFVVGDRCPQWLRTVPEIETDPQNPDDVDTEQEDHCYDETRYMILSPRYTIDVEHE